MVVIADLVAKVRAEGVDETTRAIAGAGTEADVTARAFEIMAEKAAKLGGGTATEWLENFARSGAQPTAAALEQASKEADKLTAALERTSSVARASAASIAGALSGQGLAATPGRVEGVLAAQARTDQQSGLARALEGAGVSAGVARQQAKALTDETNNAAKAAQEVSKGWTASESSLVRFGAGLAGVSVGLSLVAGVAKLVHDIGAGIVTDQLNWERSLKTLSGLYGDIGVQAAGVAMAQASLPGVLGTQQEFAQASINASPLVRRYGLPQGVADQLTTTGGRLAFATGMTDASERAQLQSQIFSAVTTGAPLPPQYGIYTDPEAVAKSLGLSGAQSLQAFTPQEVMQARAAKVNSEGSQFVDRANANQRAALDAATAAEKAVEQARVGLQNALERGGAVSREPPLGTFGSEFAYIPPQAGNDYGRNAAMQDAAETGGRNIVNAQLADAQTLANAQLAYTQALADSTKAQEDAKMVTDALANSVDAAGGKLFSFFGSLEDQTSIAHGDILAQAQGAVSARARSAIPIQGMGATEIGALARGTTFQQVWQNFVALSAQQEDTNAIQRFLNAEIKAGGPRADMADRALNQAGALEPVNRGIGEANTRAAQLDVATAETQASLERITLTQRERGLALLRETVDLRKLDVQQQQLGLAATQNVIRAQQAGLPAQYALSDAQYQTGRAAVLAQARLARTLQGKDVSGLPSIEDLVQMNVQGQFATAEAGPAAFEANRAAELAQRPATAAGLAQQLTSSQLTNAQLGVDLKNLGDLPEQTALELELVQNNRSQLSVQTELREYMKQLVYIMSNGGSSGGAPSMVPADAGDRGSTASSQLAGARR